MLPEPFQKMNPSKHTLSKSYPSPINADSCRPLIAFPDISADSYLLPCGCIWAKVAFSLVHFFWPRKRNEHSSRTDIEGMNTDKNAVNDCVNYLI